MITGKSIDAGYYHNLIIACSNDYVTGWGDNTYGQLTIPFLTGVKKISAGGVQSIAILKDDTLTGWALEGGSIPANGSQNCPTGRYLDISTGPQWSMGLISGTRRITGWGDLSNNRAGFTGVSNLTGIRQIAAGYRHSLAVLQNGQITGWGGLGLGETTLPNGFTNPISIAAGESFSLAVTSQGRLTGWGQDTSSQRIGPTGFTGVRKVVAGRNFGLALSSGGRITGWGNNFYGNTTIPAELHNGGILDIAAGYSHSLALLSSGIVIAWGDNTNSQATNYQFNCDFSGPNLPVKYGTGENCYTGTIAYGIPCSGLRVHFDSSFGVTTGVGGSVLKWVDRVCGFEAQPWDILDTEEVPQNLLSKPALINTQDFYQNVVKSGIFLNGENYFRVNFSGKNLLTGNAGKTFVFIGRLNDPTSRGYEALIGDPSNVDRQYLYKNYGDDKIRYLSYPEGYTSTFSIINTKNIGTGYFCAAIYHPPYDPNLGNSTGFLRADGITVTSSSFDNVSQNISGIMIGSRDRFGAEVLQGEIISVLIYDRKLSSLEMLGIESVYSKSYSTQTGSCCYKVEFDSYDYPSRFVVLTGDALVWDGSAGLPDYRDFGCNCVTGKGSARLCPELDNLQHGIRKVFDTTCTLTNGNTITGNLFIENNVPVKYLLIPDCSGTSTGSRWELSIDKCAGQSYYCTYPQADFSGDNTNGVGTLTVNFTDLSESLDGITSWQWDFNNDGTIDSTLQNPSYTYTTGTYSVKLIVDDPSGQSQIVKTNYITVSETPGPRQTECSEYYDIRFWTYNYPSRLVIITGDALSWNGAAGLPDYKNLGCSCITGDKNCPELDNLEHGLVKILDTYCVLRDTVPFSGNVYLPNNVAHKLLVIPDCEKSGTARQGATWKLEILSGTCVEKGCLCTTETVPVCNFNFNITFSPKISGNVSEFNLLTSYSPSSEDKTLKVDIKKGSNAFYKDMAFIVKNFDYKNTSIPGVKWLNNLYIGNQIFLSPNQTSLKLVQNEKYTVDNSNSWLQDSGDFKKYNLDYYPTGVAGTIIEISPDNNSRAGALRYGEPDIDNYTLSYNIKNTSPSFYKKEILIKDLGKRNSGVPIFYSFNSGWATYDCASGTNYKNVFSWGFQVVDKITVKDGILIESGAKFITGVQDVINKYIKEGMPPTLYTGARGAFGNLQAFCANERNCPPAAPPTEQVLCWTGNNIYDREYKLWFSGILEKYKSVTGSITGNSEGLAQFTIEEIVVNRTWQILTGFIQYNNVVSGDTFKFRLYPFDYTGLYRQLHLNNDPLYPSYDFDLVYPKDWTNLSGLVSKLNEKLAPPFSWPVWYPYYCLSGTPTGIYITGALARAWENTGTCCKPSGDLTVFDYQNRIDIEALRSFPILPSAGNTGVSGQANWFYDFTLELYTGNRRSFQIYSGYSYLIPSEIELQRFRTGVWETIDKKTDLYNQITGLESTCIVKDFETFGSDRLINFEWLDIVTGEESPIDPIFAQSENSGVYKTLYQFNQRTVVESEDYCPVVVNNLPVSLIWPENFPSVKVNKTGGIEFVDNRYWCKPEEEPGEEEGEESCKPCESGDPTVTGCVSPNILTFDSEGCCECKPAFAAAALLCQYRTGWNLTGEIGEKALLSGNADKYRVIVKNLSGQFFEGYKPVDYFYIGNINLYGLESQPLPVLQGGEQCLIGANYNIDIGGYVGKDITGEYEYTITPGMKGQFSINGLLVKELIPEEKRQVKFNKASGYVVGNYYTGVYQNLLKPSGFACHTFDGYYFYNSATNVISFEKKACEYTKVMTGITRTYDIIKQSVINKELLVGGRFSKPVDLVYITGSGNFVGQINDVIYKEYDVLGYYPLTGIVSGTTSGGRLSINQNRTGYAFTTDSVYPYYPLATGQITATGYIKIHTGNINNFDYVSINNSTIIYHNDNSLYPSPGYFNNINTLNTIINESTGVFFVTGQISGNNNIVLYSLLRGSDGNTVSLTTSNLSGIEVNGESLENGAYIYPKIYRYFYTTGEDGVFTGIEITPIFTGNILSSIVATGFYINNSGSGSITGLVPTYRGTRTFTGIWGLQTGQDNDFENFLRNNWISGVNKYYNRKLFPNTFNLLQISVRYDNELSTNEDFTDVAQIRLKDFNYNLVYPTGNLINNTGEIIFRISGVKNL